jgi:hypothetical protein
VGGVLLFGGFFMFVQNDVGARIGEQEVRPFLPLPSPCGDTSPTPLFESLGEARKKLHKKATVHILQTVALFLLLINCLFRAFGDYMDS